MVSVSQDSKFAHLLQPIRDLAANWDVDIASELEDYLDALETITFSFEDDNALNFAEAALVIQVSTCVYSRKVEYLHSLVYQALELVAQKRAQRGGQADTLRGAEAEDEDEDEEHFLNLDDVLEDGGGIDMDESSTTAVALTARPPALLLALEDTGQTHGGGREGHYQVAGCSVHKSGALLLEARDGDVLDELLRRTAHQTGAQSSSSDLTAHAFAEASTQPICPDRNDLPASEPYDDGGYSDGDDFLEAEPLSSADKQRQSYQPTDLGIDEVARDVEESAAYDPYEPLDMHAKGTLPLQPFKRKIPRRRKPASPEPTISKGIAPVAAHPTALCFPEFQYAMTTVQHGKRAQVQAARRVQATQPDLHSAFTFEEATAEQEADPADEDTFLDDGGVPSDDDNGDHPDFMPDLPADWHASNLPDNAQLETEAMTYEQLCQAHIEAFIRDAQAAQVQSELDSRVTCWQSTIQPYLEEQDARCEFDIHVYGERILQSLSELSISGSMEEEQAWVGMEAIAVDVSQWEVCRLFSAMLQLVNAGSIGIQRCPDISQPFLIQLQHKDLPYQRLANFKAPSLLQEKVQNVMQASLNPKNEAKALAGKATKRAKKRAGKA